LPIRTATSRPSGDRPAEADDLDRQREGAEAGDHLAVVGDHRHAVTRRGDDLLLQERRPAALDQVQPRVDLVGPVDGEVDPLDLVEPAERHAELLGEPDGGARGRDALDLQPLGGDPLRQEPHEPAGGRAGAETERHPVLHHLERARRGGALGDVGGSE
jgi:hypothetical protein